LKNHDRPVARFLFFPSKKSAGGAVSCQALQGWTVCRFHGARGGAPEGKRNGNYRHGCRTKEMIEVWKLIIKYRSAKP
jgi:hypothetical protein